LKKESQLCHAATRAHKNHSEVVVFGRERETADCPLFSGFIWCPLVILLRHKSAASAAGRREGEKTRVAPITEFKDRRLMASHRNLRTRRRMRYVCRQDDHIDPKIVGLAPADMAKTAHFHNYKNIYRVVNNLCWGYTYFELTLVYNENYIVLIFSF
jgi:hypothetical protein